MHLPLPCLQVGSRGPMELPSTTPSGATMSRRTAGTDRWKTAERCTPTTLGTGTAKTAMKEPLMSARCPNVMSQFWNKDDYLECGEKN